MRCIASYNQILLCSHQGLRTQPCYQAKIGLRVEKSSDSEWASPHFNDPKLVLENLYDESKKQKMWDYLDFIYREECDLIKKINMFIEYKNLKQVISDLILGFVLWNIAVLV